MLLFFLIAITSNKCYSTSSPLPESAAHTSPSLPSSASVKGKALTRRGAPVVSALVIVDDAVKGDNVYYSSHTSINRDGSFQISGIPTGPNYTLSIEPLNIMYNNHIDNHIDCFQSPISFTEGYYTGSGNQITTVDSSAESFALNNQNEVLDLGTFKLP